MKLINRQQYMDELISVCGVPDIKVITGIRRSGKSKLMEAYIEYLEKTDKDANIIVVDFSDISFENLKEYHALNDYVTSKYDASKNNYLFIDEVPLCEN